MTLWANQIVSIVRSSEQGKRLTKSQWRGDATIYARPNTKKFDHPPTKKPRTTRRTPEVHVYITPTPGAATSATQATYLVSDTKPSSATGLLHATKVSDIPGPSDLDIKPLSAPGPSRPSPTPRCARLLTTLDCLDAGRVPSVNELLSLMDREEPTANPKYADSLSELESLGSIHDAVQLYSTPVEILGTMGKLGLEGAHRLHEYCRDKLFPALGIMQTKRSLSEEASVEEIPPPVPPPQTAVKQEQQTTRAVSIEEIVQPQMAIKKEQRTIGEPSVEEIEWPQRQEPHMVQPRAIEDQEREVIMEWLGGVQPYEEVEEELASFARMKTVESENEDEDEDDSGDNEDDMATVSSHEV